MEINRILNVLKVKNLKILKNLLKLQKNIIKFNNQFMNVQL